MKKNGTENQDNGQQHDASTSDNVVAFPSSQDTQLDDLSTLLQGAPVIQQATPIRNGSVTSAEGSAIATPADFDQGEEKPFARKVGPRAVFGAGLALLAIFPLAAIFSGGAERSNDNPAVELTETGEPENTPVSAEAYAQQQAELEQMRSQQAFTDQQVDAEVIDAAGRQRQQRRASATSTSTAARPAQTRPAQTTTAQPNSITVREATAPTRVAASPSRPAPVTLASRAPGSAASPPTAQASAREPEPVDPFERRAQLQALGSYGAPPPRAKALQTASYEPVNPFETQYIQAIALAPQREIATPSKLTQVTQTLAPVEKPLTEEELQYEQDAAAVLSTDPPKDEDPVAAVEDGQLAEESSESPVTAAPTAILPGTSVEAELPYGFSWQAGTPLPEVLLLTTEDIMAGELAVIPAGTQFLAQAQIDSNSGAVTIQIVGLFGEIRNIQIPRASVIVQAIDGSVLTASASGGPSTPGPNIGGFFMESLGNGLANVIASDDSLVTDIAGGMAETLIDNQVERSQANASARNSRTSSQPIVWTLDSRSVKLTFNNFIPLSNPQ